MKLPHLENASVPEAKITGYLLSEEKSGGKSVFFVAFSFNVSDARWAGRMNQYGR